MKKLLLIPFVFLFIGTTQSFCINPIPSYNVKVTARANFLETGIYLSGNQTNKEKRLMNIETSTASAPPSKSLSLTRSIVYVYKHDGNQILGPFYIEYGQLLSVPIDNSLWGVIIGEENPGNEMLVDVWDSKGPNSQANGQTNSVFPQVQGNSQSTLY